MNRQSPRHFATRLNVGEVSSTNDEAWAAFERHGAAADGTVVIATRQTGGRGRLGRVWSSPDGNLYVSLLRRIVEPIEATSIVSLLAGIALVEAVAGVTGVRADLKWPNDLLVNGRKVAGILLEGRDGFQVVGIGLNANVTTGQLDPVVHDTATTLLDLVGQRVDVEAILDSFLAEFEALEAQFVLAPELPVDRYLAFFPFVGTRVRVTVGQEERVAPIAGVAPDGALVLRGPGGTDIRVTTGEVTHVRPDK